MPASAAAEFKKVVEMQKAYYDAAAALLFAHPELSQVVTDGRRHLRMERQKDLELHEEDYDGKAVKRYHKPL